MRSAQLCVQRQPKLIATSIRIFRKANLRGMGATLIVADSDASHARACGMPLQMPDTVLRSWQRIAHARGYALDVVDLDATQARGSAFLTVSELHTLDRAQYALESGRLNLRRLRADDFAVVDTTTGRARFGTAQQILDDIAHFRRTGALPRAVAIW